MDKQSQSQTDHEELPGQNSYRRPKLVFFVRSGLDAFIDPIIAHLSIPFTTMKIIVRENSQIDQGMNWADICWFEWCDNLIVYGSKLPIANRRKIICRLHSYEAFSSYPYQVNWGTVDKVIFVGKPIQDYVLQHVKGLSERKTVVIPNGVDLNKYRLIEREKGFNIAFVGYISAKKGPMLLLHAFKAIHDRDARYKLYIAGKYQDERYRLYFNQMIEQLNLTDAVQFEGWQTDVNRYLENKHYIISTSPLESQHMSMMEAMAAGLKPLVHHFYGAKQVYDASFVWNTIDELIGMVMDEEYSSGVYRAFIERNYSLPDQNFKIEQLLRKFLPIAQAENRHTNIQKAPKVTVGIVNYNYGRFLDECLQSVLTQAYPNIEILVVDDHSTDDSMAIIERYAKSHSNIRVIRHTDNSNLPDRAFHEIFREANGEYVLLLSADDFLPNAGVLSHYVGCFFNHPNADYVYGDITLVNVNAKAIGKWTYRSYTDEEAVQNIFQRWGSGVIPMIGMFRSSYYRSASHSWFVDPAKPIAGDTLNCLINIDRGWNRHYLQQPMLCYRRHGDSISHRIDERIVSLIYIVEYIVARFKQEILFPTIPWNTLGEREASALKHFYIGKHFAGMAVYYQTCPFTSGLDPIQKKKCVQPILARMNHYFDLSLQFGDDCKQKISVVVEQVSPLVL
ncbi:glycosyltransferase [Cohnella herbarum]|uniref:Glycosyltransferase n=1 Tax=Cohnella herbarum TaxID=2728023 RepID=A0A7Z2VIG3_9BACL|nr:glycosyltransferase [Cohnella herbarum]QJD83831.1 glycosyltransferase [Cohnella herbarum]